MLDIQCSTKEELNDETFPSLLKATLATAFATGTPFRDRILFIVSGAESRGIDTQSSAPGRYGSLLALACWYGDEHCPKEHSIWTPEKTPQHRQVRGNYDDVVHIPGGGPLRQHQMLLYYMSANRAIMI